MCTKGTPLRTRLFCSCSHALLAGTVVVLALLGWFAWTHLLLLLGMAGLVVAGTTAAVWWLMRFAQPVINRPVRVEASPVPVAPAPAPSAPDVLAAEAQAYADAAFDARMQP